MFSTAIITAPRPRYTLDATIRSFRAAGFDERVLVFAEPGVDPILDDNVTFVRNETRLGNLRNWVRALSILERDPIGRWLIVCEDDIEFAKGSAAALSDELDGLTHTNEFRRSGVLSLYLPRRHYKHLPKLDSGWHSQGLQQGRKTWGAQCFMFSRHQAAELLGDQRFKDVLADPSIDTAVDAWVGKSVDDRGLNVLYRVPCLVNHTLGDANSSLGYKEDRPDLRTDYFRGYP